MKIQFIGTASIQDMPNSASILINDHILFDVPNGNLKAMIRQKIDILKIDTIIISHTHADHCFDVPFILWYRKKFGKDSSEVPIKIITDEITKKTIETLINLSHFNPAREAKKEFIDCKSLTNIKLFDNIDIINVPMKHIGIEHANGYIIKDKNTSIGLTGDTSFCEGVRKLANNIDILISDMTLEIGDDSHMGINNILSLVKEYPKLKIIPIHMHDGTREQAKKLNIENLTILDDGDIIEL